METSTANTEATGGEQMAAMVVVAHGGPEQLQLQQIERPVPGAGQLRLKMTATSVNFADTKARRAPYRHFQAPFVPGFDGVGVIEDISQISGADRPEWLKPGQRVAAYVKGGSYAAYALSTPTLCYPLPDDVSDDDAIGIGVAITAHNALRWAGRFAEGERVLIHAAAGGVGSTAIQLAKRGGASQIIASIGDATGDVDWFEQKRQVALDAGADHIITTSPGFAAEVTALTEGAGVDVILDTIGGQTLEEGMGCLNAFGRLVSFGHSSGADGSVLSRPLHRHNRAVIGYSSGGYRKARPEALRPTAEAVVAMWHRGELRTHVGARFALEDAAAAHARFETRTNLGKLMLRID